MCNVESLLASLLQLVRGGKSGEGEGEERGKGKEDGEEEGKGRERGRPFSIIL